MSPQSRLALLAIVGTLCLASETLSAAETPLPSGQATRIIRFDRASLHREAVEDSLKPIRPGVPGTRPFWNGRASAFMYAPSFNFEPIRGAKRYRFSITAYGATHWTFDATNPNASLGPVWRDLPLGGFLVEREAVDQKGNVPSFRQGLPPGQWVAKKAVEAPAPTFAAASPIVATKYRFTVWQAKELTYEADTPWASLSPVWEKVPVGAVVLKVEGIEREGGRSLGLATIRSSPSSAPKTFHRFHRKAVFHGPYHEAADNYRSSARRWLTWLAGNDFKKWADDRPPKRLSGYTSKFVGAAVFGMAALAALEAAPREKEAHLRTAASAARALMAASFPASWGLAYFPPTYANETGRVMMKYPAQVGLAYLDLYEAAGDRDMLAAARRIADTYRKTQQSNGTWPLLMDAKSGARLPESSTELVPDGVLLFLDRLIERHGLDEFRPIAEAAWRWIEQEILTSFRFEGQFEDVSRRGGRSWNLSPLPACSIAERLLRRHRDSASHVELAEAIIRFAEDQFVIWEQPVPGDVDWQRFPRLPFTPTVLEQYAYMVPVTGSVAKLMGAFQAAYLVTGKEIYLAKAAALANAMTVLQARNGGNYVGVTWNPAERSGGWPNVHAYAAVALAAFGEMLERERLRLEIAK